MRIYLKEKIGNPELFTGRKEDLAFFQKWIAGIKKEISKSMAILSRRKTGKTALMQRLYNLTFEQNDGVIPFYYEMKEGQRWGVDFCRDFYLTFIWQYLAFKTRRVEYLYVPSEERLNLAAASAAAQRDGLGYLANAVASMAQLFDEAGLDTIWLAVRDAPFTLATSQREFIVQMFDEFQYLNSEIYRDQACQHLASNFAGGYMSTAEYRNAPLLVSGSWIGWLRGMLHTLLPSRFRQYELENIPEDEALEMVFRYSQIMDVPVSEDVAYALAKASEGNPFYISSLFESPCKAKDFTTQEGLLNTLEYETLNERGQIRSVWMEYLYKVFYKVNEVNAKNMLLYLSKHQDREISRKELLDALHLPMTESELEQKLRALLKSDLIEQGRSNFYYRGVQDNIFDKVFRGMYADDIQAFDPQEITNEYKALYAQAKQEYQALLGRYNQTKGLFAEFAIINHLRLRAHREQERFRAMIRNLPEDFAFVEYESVWSYKTARPDKNDIAIDLFARAGEDAYSIIGEVKNRDTTAFSKEETLEFIRKVQILQERESVGKALLFVFSRHGFTADALTEFQASGIAYSDDERWLENS
ncbi:hypothetical protein U14_04461 [Candidatus Moduliflexus flocculans]|uniref:ATPase domain-containing protein n=1 Tax=Candidatus Moduliflexus flocculans TaxID=1499966 RepID=A0A0S6W0N9_9BACT|nr:hypothetical protein U14_04461 [Candidatus Moduliflexus flocculans]